MTLIGDFMLPHIEGDSLISSDNIFEQISTLFDKTSRDNGGIRPGAIKIRFSDAMAVKMNYNPQNYTSCVEVKTFHWQMSETSCGLYCNVDNDDVEHDTGKRVPEILSEGKIYNRRFTAEDSLEDLESYINICARKHPYAYDFQPTDEANFQYMGALNMCTMEDYVRTKYRDARGIATAWGMAAPAGTITGLHLEDRKLLSINQMFTDGDKFWLFPQIDSENLENFIRAASREVTKMRGSPEYFKDPCHCFHLKKAFFFSPKWFLEHGIRFNIILQQRNDIVITDTNGFHEIINTVDNVTMARNLCIGRSRSAFTDDYIKCGHAHHRLKTISKLGLLNLQGLESWLSNPIVPQVQYVLLRSSVFEVSHAKWVQKSKSQRRQSHDARFNEIRALFRKYMGISNSEDNLVESIHRNNRLKLLYVVLGNLGTLCHAKVTRALQRCFTPSSETQSVTVTPVLPLSFDKVIGEPPLHQGHIKVPYYTYEMHRETLQTIRGLQVPSDMQSFHKRKNNVPEEGAVNPKGSKVNNWTTQNGDSMKKLGNFASGNVL